MAEAGKLFLSSLSDSNQIGPCATSQGMEGVPEMDIEVPETFDWREAYPNCVQEPLSIGASHDCSAAYVFATLSAAEDRICMGSNSTVRLSRQEVLDCDSGSMGCQGGFVNRVMAWGKKKGFILEECLEYAGKQQECEVDHFESNACRLDNSVFKATDYCMLV
jgi:hypothetical protein